jgi:S1-C subfamily serine protease
MIEQMLFTTVRITTTSAAGQGLGTGFLWMKVPDPEGRAHLFLVTNKHVVENQSTAVLHFIAGASDGPRLGEEITVTIDDPPSAFVGHPDPNIDVAVLPVGGVISQLRESGREVYFRAVSESQGATPESLAAFEPIEPVTFIGYPNGLYDSTSLLPIVRRGHSATPLTIDYEGRPMFLVDASVFPGSSGSPVFLMRNPSAPDKFGNITIGAPSQVIFLGVVAAVYQRAVPVLTVGSTGQFVHDALDIGIVYKASTIASTVDTVLGILGNGPA